MEPAEPEPPHEDHEVVEIPLHERPLLWRHLTEDQQKEYFSKDAQHAAETLASYLGVTDYIGATQTARGAIYLDYCMYTLSFAQEAGFNDKQISTVFSIALEVLKVVRDGGSFIDAENQLKELLLPLCTSRVRQDAANFNVQDVKAITGYFTAGLFSHYRLYHLVYTEEQALEELSEHMVVEQGRVQSFKDVMDESQWAAYNQALEDARMAAEAEARRLQEEEEARLKAEEEARLKAEEEERLRLEEEERKKRPQSLEEAVQFHVRLKVDDLKAELSAHYKAREEQLLQKIALLESQLTGQGA